jgi:membrane peptidoglycan carboxypeptidase
VGHAPGDLLGGRVRGHLECLPVEYLEQTVEARFGRQLLDRGGLSVDTTLNRTMQRAAEQALRQGL